MDTSLERKILSTFGNGPGTTLISILNDAGADDSWAGISVTATGAIQGATVEGTTSIATPSLSVTAGGAGSLSSIAAGALATFSLVSGSYSAGMTVSGSISQAAILGTSGAASLYLGGVEAAASSYTKRVYTKTGIADNSATAVVTVTVPNGNHAAMIRVTAMGTVGSTDAFESTAVAEAIIVLTRITGANVVAQVATVTLGGTAIATVSGGAALSAAPTIGVSSITGAVGADNTFTINITVNDSGGVGSNTAILVTDLINSQGTGVTMAAAA